MIALSLIALIIGVSGFAYAFNLSSQLSAANSKVDALNQKVDSLSQEISDMASELGFTSLDELRQLRQLEEGAKSEGALLWYASRAPVVDALAAAFQQKYPYVKLEYLAGAAGEAVTKLQEEYSAGAPTADVLSSGTDDYATVVLAGMIENYLPPEASKLSNASLSDYQPSGYGFPVWCSKFTFAYNTKLISSADAPKSWTDLTNPKYKGDIAFSDFRLSGTALGVLMALEQLYGEQFIMDLAKQNIVFPDASSSRTTQAVARGEYPISGIADPAVVAQSKSQGLPIEYVIPSDHNVPGTCVPSGLVKKARHPNAAKLFLNFLASDDGQKVVGSITSPARAVPGAPVPREADPNLWTIVPWPSVTGDAYKAAVDRYTSIFVTQPGAAAPTGAYPELWTTAPADSYKATVDRDTSIIITQSSQ
jgi:iron(III) transport system substrate-binding protein